MNVYFLNAGIKLHHIILKEELICLCRQFIEAVSRKEHLMDLQKEALVRLPGITTKEESKFPVKDTDSVKVISHVGMLIYPATTQILAFLAKIVTPDIRPNPRK